MYLVTPSVQFMKTIIEYARFENVLESNQWGLQVTIFFIG